MTSTTEEQVTVVTAVEVVAITKVAVVITVEAWSVVTEEVACMNLSWVVMVVVWEVNTLDSTTDIFSQTQESVDKCSRTVFFSRSSM